MKILIVLTVEVDDSFIDAVEEQRIGEISNVRATMNRVDDQPVVGGLLQLVQIVLDENVGVEQL